MVCAEFAITPIIWTSYPKDVDMELDIEGGEEGHYADRAWGKNDTLYNYSL